jgi:hypothetical protein
MDWYENMWEACAEDHDPAEHNGREWDDLTDEEREAAINDRIAGIADAGEVM